MAQANENINCKLHVTEKYIWDNSLEGTLMTSSQQVYFQGILSAEHKPRKEMEINKLYKFVTAVQKDQR